MAADPAFLSMFDVQVIRGNIANPFPDISSAIITESEAKALFGCEPDRADPFIRAGKNFQA